jgi:hypothetical protein
VKSKPAACGKRVFAQLLFGDGITAIEVSAGALAQRFTGRPVALALEQSRGALIPVLSKYPHLTVAARMARGT